LKSQRLASLDAFRGMTIAGMILVSNPGSWDRVYAPFKHAEWHGWTPADLVFPFFIFIVGCSISLAFSRRLDEGEDKSRIYMKVFRRSAVLFCPLGWRVERFSGLCRMLRDSMVGLDRTSP